MEGEGGVMPRRARLDAAGILHHMIGGGIGDVPRIYGLSMGILFKQSIKKPYPFRGGYCALVGKTEHGIQNIDYELNIFGGRIP
jgi:hypothetical protein